MRRFIILSVALIVALALMPMSAQAGEDLGVYVKAVANVQGTFDEAVKATEQAFEAAPGWKVLASYASGVEDECNKRAHNIVVVSDEYAGEIIKNGPHAAFAVVLRVGIYNDEQGTSIDFTNPASINRTILGDDVAVELSKSTAAELSKIISDAVKGDAVNAQIGQIRDKGYVGGMGGGKFMKKIVQIHFGGEYDVVKAKIKEGVAADEKGWKLVYTYDVPGSQTTVFGLTEAATEAKAFHIAGEKRWKKSKKKWICPGIDHASAFPIEVVQYKESEEASVKVVTLDEMYRMKLYFQDAGNWAFMKNMSMPGHIEDEVTDAATSKL
jgi:hypothetical protein